jgi:hypothetical protein
MDPLLELVFGPNPRPLGPGDDFRAAPGYAEGKHDPACIHHRPLALRVTPTRACNAQAGFVVRNQSRRLNGPLLVRPALLLG